jgi:glycerophosphoryl diester phosphodiesterase
MTLAAYQEAIDWSLVEGVAVGLECDVRLTADDQLVCLHDASLGRTAHAFGPVSQWSLPELRTLDFGSWKTPEPTPAQRALVTLEELVGLVLAARLRGADVSLVIETKHPQPGGLELDQRVCQLLAAYGWDRPGAPVRLITFSLPAAELLARQLPVTDRTLLIEGGPGPCAGGTLPAGIRVVGVDIRLLRTDPGFVTRAVQCGNEVHAWTVNEWSDIALCLELGVTGLTSDYPDRVLEMLRRSAGARGGRTPRERSALASSAA